MSDVKVVLLCGGLGTRLREETSFRPKPMVEVGGRPILWHIMKIFAHHSITDFVICVGYKGDVIRDYFLGYEVRNGDFTITMGEPAELVLHDRRRETTWRVTIAATGQETQTGGRVRRVERYLDDEPFMVTYGDGLADIDLGSLLAFHQGGRRAATLTAVQPTSRFGVVDISPDGSVGRFREKPKVLDWVNAGFFVFEPCVLDLLTDDCVLEQEPLRELASAGELGAYRHDGFWQPMDTYREQKLLDDLWETGAAPWRIWDD